MTSRSDLATARHLSLRKLNIRNIPTLLFAVALCLLLPIVCFSQTKRVVVLQCDGLPYDMVDRFARERDPRTGKSRLPWIDYIFYQRGTRLANFYVRGTSLSGPSWSLLGTGQHLQIKGNVEFDRYTMQTYDYLNFIPFYVQATIGKRIDMQGVEVLDAIGIPILSDAFLPQERHATFSLFQRAPRYMTFGKAIENKFKRPPKELVDEWTLNGLGLRDSVPAQLARELIEAVGDPRRKYLELVVTDFDHVAHHNNDRESHLFALKRIDETLGQIWSAIHKTPLASETALILVSDHGFNTDNRVYSQGYNLVKLLGSTSGGGHHVITKRRLLVDYALKGINPFITNITTTSRDSSYLQGQSRDYPTAMVDFDGNERATLQFRDSDLNLLHILLQQLQRPNLAGNMRKALSSQFFETLNRRRPVWQKNIDEINEELGALRRRIEQQRELCASQPKKFSQEDMDAKRDDQAKRVCAWLDIWIGQEQNYGEYVRTLTNLLALRPETFNPAQLKIAEVLAPRAMGDQNSVFQLQNYIVAIAPGGLRLRPDDSLDLDNSFLRVDYYSLLRGLSVRNNVQPGISNRPVDFIVTRIPSDLVKSKVNETGLSPDVVWVDAGPDRQALVLARENSGGGLSFRYVPIKNLRQDASGKLSFEPSEWRNGLPLQMFEDEYLNLPSGNREDWLSQWHTDQEWLRATHRTRYSNGVIGLFEQVGRHAVARLAVGEPGISADERLLRRLLRRQRSNIESDLLVIANDHWNFDVRGFNPGGNHGSFLRVSTHSTFMLWGGNRTSIPSGAVVEQPYDSLSFVPTVLALTGKLRDDNSPIPALMDKGFRRFPGSPVKEVLDRRENRSIAGTGATASP